MREKPESVVENERIAAEFVNSGQATLLPAVAKETPHDENKHPF